MTREVRMPIVLKLESCDARGACLVGEAPQPGTLVSGFVVVQGKARFEAHSLTIERATGGLTVELVGSPLLLTTEALEGFSSPILLAARDRIRVYAHPLATSGALKLNARISAEPPVNMDNARGALHVAVRARLERDGVAAPASEPWNFFGEELCDAMRVYEQTAERAAWQLVSQLLRLEADALEVLEPDRASTQRVVMLMRSCADGFEQR